MVDNQGTDTSQGANPLFDESVFNAPAEQSAPKSSTQDNTLTPTDAFTEPSGEEAPQEAPSTQETTQPLEAKNDDTRFEYWQSQAAKRDNELKQVQEQLQQFQQQQNAPQPQQAMTPEQQVQEEFPPPPEKPVKPRSFNRQEAYEDPNSESARYLDEVDEWRDNMDEYGMLRNQYETALVQENMQKMQSQQQEAERVRQARIQQANQMREVSDLVQGHYGMSQQETQEFIKTMSDPSSITVDNLVQLYRLQKGQAVNPATPQTAQPSEAFQQAQRAQQVPSPMGVQPTAGQNQVSSEDQIMDNMISDFKSKNPW
tara:strand:- start:1509 stop:2450 length:942 start_codon:yes stop_codon:yes gene_type:complete